MPIRLDTPIVIEPAADGRPSAIVWEGRRYAVRVLRSWDGRVHRVAATLADGPAIGELAQDAGGTSGRLYRWWTATP